MFAHRETEPKSSAIASLSSLPPEIVLLIAESLAPMDQLHLGMTCKTLLYLTAPIHLGESIMRQPRQKSTQRSAFCEAYDADFMNLELYDYLLERTPVSKREFNLVCRVAGRCGDIEKLEAWSRLYEMCAFVGAAEGAAETGQIALLEWALERLPPLNHSDCWRILCAAALSRQEDVVDFFITRLDLTPFWLADTVTTAAEVVHIDLALKIYRQLPLCCSEGVFLTAAEAIAWRSIRRDDWQTVLAEFLVTPSVISDAVGSSVFQLAVSHNRLDVMRYVDEKCGPVDNHQQPYLPLSRAIANGNTDAFDYICQTRPNWTTLVDDAIKDPHFKVINRIDTCIALLRRVMPHITKRSTLITLIRKASDESKELVDFAAEEFRRRFGSPSQDELRKLYSGAFCLEIVRALAEHFPPQSTEHANDIARSFLGDERGEAVDFLREFCLDMDSDLSDY